MEEDYKPIGWPEGIPFPRPSKEEVAKAIEEGEEMILKMHEELKGKIDPPGPEFYQLIIDI